MSIVYVSSSLCQEAARWRGSLAKNKHIKSKKTVMYCASVNRCPAPAVGESTSSVVQESASSDFNMSHSTVSRYSCAINNISTRNKSASNSIKTRRNPAIKGSGARESCAIDNINTRNQCALTDSSTKEICAINGNDSSRNNYAINNSNKDALNCAVNNNLNIDEFGNDFGDPAGENAVDSSGLGFYNEDQAFDNKNRRRPVETASERRRQVGQTQTPADHAYPADPDAFLMGNSLCDSWSKMDSDSCSPAKHLRSDAIGVVFDVTANQSDVVSDCPDAPVSVEGGVSDDRESRQEEEEEEEAEARPDQDSVCLFPPIESSAKRPAVPPPQKSDPAVSSCVSLPDLNPHTVKTPVLPTRVKKREFFKGTGLVVSGFPLPPLFKSCEE